MRKRNELSERVRGQVRRAWAEEPCPLRLIGEELAMVGLVSRTGAWRVEQVCDLSGAV